MKRQVTGENYLHSKYMIKEYPVYTNNFSKFSNVKTTQSSDGGRRGSGQATQLPKALGAARPSGTRLSPAPHDAQEQGQLRWGGGEGGAQEEIFEVVS